MSPHGCQVPGQVQRRSQVQAGVDAPWRRCSLYYQEHHRGAGIQYNNAEHNSSYKASLFQVLTAIGTWSLGRTAQAGLTASGPPGTGNREPLTGHTGMRVPTREFPPTNSRRWANTASGRLPPRSANVIIPYSLIRYKLALQGSPSYLSNHIDNPKVLKVLCTRILPLMYVTVVYDTSQRGTSSGAKRFWRREK